MGKIIKGLAQVLFWVYMLAGITVSIVITDKMESGGQSATVIIVGLIVTFIISYIAVMMMYAFGSIVDDLKEIRERVTVLSGGHTVPNIPVSPVFPVKSPENDGSWICPNCGYQNDKNCKFCVQCGSGK